MTSWTDYQDDISDAISDSMDMDWNANDGARAVVRWLNENKPLSAAPAPEGGAVEPSWRESFIADEEEGPVSGILIDLSDGSQIWTGDCSSALLNSMGDERPDESGQFLTVAIQGKPTRVVASVASTQDGIALARALAARLAAREEAPAEAGALVHQIDALLAIPEANLSSRIPYLARELLERSAKHLRDQPQAREDAQPVARVSPDDMAQMTCFANNHGTVEDWHVWCRIRSALIPHPTPDALRVAVEALEAIRAEANRTEGNWLHMKRVIALNCDKALAALQAEQKGGAA